MSQNIFNDGTTNSAKQNDSIFSLSNIKEKLQYQNGHINWKNLVYECRNSRKLVLLVVFIALFFDNMLMTTVGKFVFINYKFLKKILHNLELSCPLLELFWFR